MTETKDTTDKTLRGGARKPMSLQRTVESGHVRQNFSHGRSKSVVVGKKEKAHHLRVPAVPRRGGSDAADGGGSSAGRGDAAAWRPLHRRARCASARPFEAAHEGRAEAGEQAERDRMAPPAAARTEPEPRRKPGLAPRPVEPQVADKIEKPETPAADKAAVEAKARPGEKKGYEAPKRVEQIAKRSGRALPRLEPEDEDDARNKKKGAKPAKSPSRSATRSASA